MENIIFKIEEIMWSYPLIIFLIFIHIFLSIKLKFPQKHIVYGLKNLFNFKGEISSFSSMMTVLAAMLGTGNIVGVSTAIIVGGAGSVFWIFISGIFAIATKYAETYLCLKFRKKKIDKKNNKVKYYGGAMYVLEEKVGSKFLGIMFSIFVVLASFGIGCMIQSNSASNILVTAFNLNNNSIALCITIICSIIVFSSAKIISRISSVIVPISGILFILMQVGLLYIFRDNVLNSITVIIKEAFNFKSASAGIFSFIAVKALSTGLSKGMFSNEAGMGSTPLFESVTSEKNIVKQSYISSVSVFIDTVCLCTLTGIVIVSSNIYMVYDSPMKLVKEVFSYIPYGNLMLVFCLVSFSLSAIPCWSYYGKEAIRYLFKSDLGIIIYKCIYCICIYLGCITTIKIVWSVSSIANALMVIPNCIMIMYLYKSIDSNKL